MSGVKMYEVGVMVVDGEDAVFHPASDPAVSPYKTEALAISRAQVMQERNWRSASDVKYIPVFDIVGPDGLRGRVNHAGEFEEA